MLKALISFFTGKKASSAALSKNGGSIRDLEGFVQYVVSALVDAPEEVRIETVENDEGYVIRINCKKEDIGKIVGKKGKTIMAIRSLVSGAAGRQQKRISVEVLD